MDQEYDLAVVGAGLAGLTAALCGVSLRAWGGVAATAPASPTSGPVDSR